MRRVLQFAQFAFVLALYGPATLPAQTNPVQTTPAQAALAAPYAIEVPGNAGWTDSGVDLEAGQTVTISGSGKIRYLSGGETAPGGLPRSWRDMLRSLPVNGAGRGALIGRIGDGDMSRAFLVGASTEVRVRVPGRLFLGINGPAGDTAEGAFHATVLITTPGLPSNAPAGSPSEGSPSERIPSERDLTRLPAGSGFPAASGAVSSPGTTTTVSNTAPRTVPREWFEKIPRRIADKEGTPGDMVNFLLIGSEEQVKAGFEASGWVLVDRDTTTGVMQAILATLSNQAYLTMPMSQLYLFGREQDFGFAHAEPVSVVATRHHFRLWKSTFTLDGQPVWVGAGTHDTGFERDQRNGQITHGIDPDVDKEREYIGRSLESVGHVAYRTSVLPPDPLTEARTAHGGRFFSNGEVLVLWLKD